MAEPRSRIAELRRRIQKDPSFIAFAQLAEEYRRAGALDEAVEVCRTGLARQPGYVSARVTLGRALLELNRLDDAEAELADVLDTAPDTLAAWRGLGEIARRRGNLELALTYARRALSLAKNDPDLEQQAAELDPSTGRRQLLGTRQLVSQPHKDGASGSEPPPPMTAHAADPGGLAVLERWLTAIDGFRSELHA